MAAQPLNVLFLCSDNAVLSLFAESILTQLGGGRFHAWSAGAMPRDGIHPLTRYELSKQGFPIEGMKPKSWSEFASPQAPVMDFIFVLGERAAAELWPVWPGEPILGCWSVYDPVAVIGPDWLRRSAFATTCRELRHRIAAFVNLRFEREGDQPTLAAQVEALEHLKQPRERSAQSPPWQAVTACARYRKRTMPSRRHQPIHSI